MNDQASYVAAVAALYAELPDTPLCANASDQWLARRLFDGRVPLRIVEIAMLLGSLRRIARPSGAPALQPIRSLAYFRPVVVELQSQQVPDGYHDYLRLKLNNTISTVAGQCSKNYASS
jgi:hypothetical protein